VGYLVDIVSRVTLWLTTSTGWDLAMDVADDDLAAAMAQLIAAGRPTNRPRPEASRAAEPETPAAPPNALPRPGVNGLRAALDMQHAQRLVTALGATRQTQCVTVLAYEAQRAGLDELPALGPKPLVEELLGKQVGSSERAMLANAVTPSHMVAWTEDKDGVRLDNPGRAYLAPALDENGEVVAPR
jgi:hypothetical protein